MEWSAAAVGGPRRTVAVYGGTAEGVRALHTRRHRLCSDPQGVY